MEKLSLIRPNPSYADQISEFKQELLNAGSSMDGCSSLKKTDDPLVFIHDCKVYENRDTGASRQSTCDIVYADTKQR